MKYQLINKPNKNFSAIQQILYNRGIAEDEILHYVNLSDQDINSPLSLGETNLKNGLMAIINTVKEDADALVIVDCDCDGYTSAALLINYLYKLFPSWVANHLDWYMHDSKQHGLSDCIDFVLARNPMLVICPDSSSNDYSYHKILADKNIQVLVLDHHLADHISENAIIINNQLSDYPNKELSGVGVVWQFCRYVDTWLNIHYADDFIDLVALGNDGDMMSLKSLETRYLITKGFKKENIKNPFIDYMLDKNSFPLSKADYVSSDSSMSCTSIGAAFFIVPFVNAITRSGTLEEKHLLFNSMLNHKAFEEVLSNKRGHKLGEKEKLILQAIRTVTNVKNRQTRAEEAGLTALEKMIKTNNMLDHKILLFLLEPGQIEPEIRGLIANKFMAKYQRPCCLLTRTTIKKDALIQGEITSDNEYVCPREEGEPLVYCGRQKLPGFFWASGVKEVTAYQGSMRGYTKTGINSFKKVLEQCPGVLYVEGHDNAAGLGIEADHINDFLDKVDQLLENVSVEPIYRIDYDFKEKENNNQKILQIARMNDYWGQDVDRAYVNINFKITSSNFQIMKNNTFKFNLLNGLSIIKFGGTEEQANLFTTTGYLEINAICKCNANEWNGQVTPQLIMQDYEIIDSSKYFF